VLKTCLAIEQKEKNVLINIMQYEQILRETEAYIQSFFDEKIEDKFVFHDLEHTVQTVGAARALADGFELSDRDLALVQLAAWFHDTGYTGGAADHEARSCAHATEYLGKQLPEEDMKVILGCIKATKIPQSPVTLLEQLLCDADLSHLGMKTYWDRTGKLRQEFILTRDLVMSEQDWINFELNFMLGHEYHTTVAREMFNKKKAKHIQQLLKQKRRLSPDEAPTVHEIAITEEKSRKNDMEKLLKDSESEIKNSRQGRGVETMYRTTYRTHTNLSSMADSKANLMLSVNAIVISIVVTNLIPQLKDNPKLAIPTALLTLTCLGSMIYATLSTRPKVTEGNTTRDMIKQRKVNLLFFGNFYNMKLEDFQWGVGEMLRDPEFLYGSMSRDLYFLGKVLAQKYQYLSICYNIFMYGIIISVLAFGAAYMF
jgi:predicted metal-dependent HD superfamily phosphohydrolase